MCVWVGGDKARALAFEIKQEWFVDHRFRGGWGEGRIERGGARRRRMWVIEGGL